MSMHVCDEVGLIFKLLTAQGTWIQPLFHVCGSVYDEAPLIREDLLTHLAFHVDFSRVYSHVIFKCLFQHITLVTHVTGVRFDIFRGFEHDGTN